MGLPWPTLPKRDQAQLRISEETWVEEGTSPTKLWVHVALFAGTFCTVTLNGAIIEGKNPFRDWHTWQAGLPFAFALMSILLVHELGHYLMARYHRVPASLPYFIPAPPIFVGTFGAFIRLNGTPPTRAALFDVGAAGPWAGFFASLIALVIGLPRSEIRPIVPDEMALYLGDSLITKGLTAYFLGTIPDGYGLYFHPIAFAGWVGLFVTLVNLVPIGQLDGGHILYAVAGRHHAALARATWMVVMWLGLFVWVGWCVWGILPLVLGMDHPPTRADWVPLDRLRTAIAAATLVMLVAVFIPIPARPLLDEDLAPPHKPTPESQELIRARLERPLLTPHEERLA